MRAIALAVTVSFGTLLTALAVQDPLARGNLTASERAAGLQSTDIEVNGANCRFCRINIERTLLNLPGVKAAAADMSHHRARVVFDPAVLQPKDLVAAVSGRD